MAAEHERLPPAEAGKAIAEAIELAMREQDPAKKEELMRLAAKLSGDSLDVSQADLNEWRRQVAQITESAKPEEPPGQSMEPPGQSVRPPKAEPKEE